MAIHNLQTEFRLLIAIVYTRDSNNIEICAQEAFTQSNFHAYARSQYSDPFIFRYVDTPYTVDSNLFEGHDLDKEDAADPVAQRL